MLPALTQTRERTSKFTMAVLILLGLSLCPLVLVGVRPQNPLCGSTAYRGCTGAPDARRR